MAVLSPSLYFVFGLSLYMSKNVGFILPWPKKLRQPHAAGAQASALSSMHAPVVFASRGCLFLCRFASNAWLSQFFLARVSRSTNVNPGNRQADRGCMSRRCDQ